jgi:hypothetical protein
MVWDSYPTPYKAYFVISKLVRTILHIATVVSLYSVTQHYPVPTSPFFSSPLAANRLLNLAHANTSLTVSCAPPHCAFGSLSTAIAACAVAGNGSGNGTAVAGEYSIACFASVLLSNANTSSNLVSRWNGQLSVAQAMLPRLSSTVLGNVVISSLENAAHALFGLHSGVVAASLFNADTSYHTPKALLAHVLSIVSLFGAAWYTSAIHALRGDDGITDPAACTIGSTFVMAELLVAGDATEASAVTNVRDLTCFGQWDAQSLIGKTLGVSVFVIVMVVIDLVAHACVHSGILSSASLPFARFF